MMTPREVIDAAIYGGPGVSSLGLDMPWAATATGRVMTALVAAGYVIVPAEPTREMLDAAFECRERHNREFPYSESGPAIDPSGEEYWRAMLAAAPK